MVRKYQRKLISTRNSKVYKPYFAYTRECLEKAVKDVRSKKLSLRQAAAEYHVPKSTIERHIKGTIHKTPGHPTLFSKTEESIFLNYIKLVALWGFPLNLLDLRVFAKRYLDKIGRKIYWLKHNLPGRDWAANFIRRHQNEISNRLSSNITTDRAKLDETTIDHFFDNFEVSVRDVEPDCLVNFDETNLTDNPGAQKFIYKRGTKYPERVVNSTKTAISLMFCGAADGTLLNTYVVYKSEHLYDTWMLGGPQDVRYNKTRSGWFDSHCFEDWFISVIIPYVKTKEGKRVVVIGDNLSSHFSDTVLELCGRHNISFVCLPPKSTHILQPLDVAFYAPLKHYWRIILTEWKRTTGRKQKTLAKNSFPELLQKLLTMLKDKGSGSQNLISGFNKCGLYPVNRDKPKSRIPQREATSNPEHINKNVSAVVVDILQEIRGSSSEITKPRKKRCNVPAGKSVTLQDIQQKENNDNNKGKTKGKTNQKKQKNAETWKNKENRNYKKKCNNRKRAFSASETSNSDVTLSIHSDSDVIDCVPDSEPEFEIPFEIPIFLETTHNDNNMQFQENHQNNLEKDNEENGQMTMEKENEDFVPEQQINLDSANKGSSELTTLMNQKDPNLKDLINQKNPAKSQKQTRNTLNITEDEAPSLTQQVLNKSSVKGKLSLLTADKDSPSIKKKKNKKIESKNKCEAVKKSIESRKEKSKIRETDVNSEGPCSSYNRTTNQSPNKHESAGCSRYIPDEIGDFHINDTVLVRYIFKKKVEYYVGVILNILKEGKVKISFYKTYGRNDNTKFVKPKKEDIDIVDITTIVKTCDLLALDEQRTEFVFFNDDDLVYFDY